MVDQRFRDQLLQAEIEDCKLLQKEISSYLEFWGIAAESADAAVPDPQPQAS